ncbi:MAG: hypothetical protein C7B46_11175 [Sulfobacillus benefaciens]|uniref:Major facilitator superfamily (MFS) profile domain-containing protein n=1 Tax=Sulfobacillus benefaciens TaxID=453960 RepID=A0A2T2XF73_9FIRM|nr:MAG: hypothetical protein C7B46_11175 [Sulfobacillus benefaciens]
MHPKKEQWGLSAYWFSLNMEGAALLTILIPVTLVRLSRTGHIGELARLASLAAILAMMVPPIAGAYSDRQRRQGKPRKPMLWWGTTANVVGLMIIPYARSITVLTLLFVLMIVGQSGAQSAYQAMMPEVLPQNQWGKASGYMGLASLLGTVAGLGFAGFSGTNVSYRAIAMVLVVGALCTTVWVHEPKGPVTSTGPHVKVRNHRDFVRVFWARFLVLLGQTFLMTFILYFFRDVLHVSSPATQTAMVAGLALVGAAVSTVFMGRLSDRVSRKFIVFFAGLPMAIAALGFGLDPRLSLVALWAVLYGVGYGAFLSVDWALGLESIPDLANVARDLGVWGIASNFPSVIAPAIGGWILLHAADPKSGYQILFLLASGTFFLGSVAVLLVGRRRPPKAWSPVLAWIVGVVVGIYVKLRYHVRVLGEIPAYYGATLVVGNHGHDIEGMAIPEILLKSRHFGDRVISAGSQRLMEPGFLPTRMPWPWGRWLSRINLGGLLWKLGVRPIENEPLFRPISSWGYTVFKSYGNLLITEVFIQEVVDFLTQGQVPPMFLRDLWSPRYVAIAVTPRAVTILKEPYRKFCKDEIRQRVRRQMDDILSSVGPGDVLYLTPEGRYTEDGRLGRFRHFWYEAVEHIPNVVLAATSYDLLRPGSLHMWIHFSAWNHHDEASSVLTSIRPMTASHLVAHVLKCCPAVSWDQALELAIQLWQEDKDKFIWANDLKVDANKVIGQALSFVQSSTWEKTGALGDARFPYVADLITYYENQWQETELAWRHLAVARAVSATPEVGL